MKHKIYIFGKHESISNFKESIFTENFEIVEPVSEGDPQEILKLKPDVIFLKGQDYEKFKPYLSAVDWRTNQIGFADVLINIGGRYKPENYLSETVLSVLKQNVQKINSLLPVIIIGDYYFAYSMAVKLATNGFIKIIVSLVENSPERAVEFEKKIKSFVFDLNIKMIPINELTTSEQVAFLLISNFEKEKNKDAYELLTYFNFLSEGAVFIDCNSIKDTHLVEDARKAEVFVIDEVEILRNMFSFLVEKLKNQPKV